MPHWTRDRALEYTTALAEHLKPYGLGVGLTGSVLTQGSSRHDLDIIVYPYDSTAYDQEIVVEALQAFKMELLHDTGTVHRRWRRLGSKDEKTVQVWTYERRRVDVFLLK